jgi:hypothetical protein
MRHQLKWRAKSVSSSTTDPWISQGEEVTHHISQDRAKVAARKVKMKENSMSQSESYSAVGGMMSTVKKLNTSFAKAQL